MNVCVDNLKDRFLDVIQDVYNEAVYLVAPCIKFPDKYGAQYSLMDLSLNIFFQENNKIILGGKLIKYCDKDEKKKIKLATICLDKPDINITKNYILEDKWDKTEW